MAQSATPRVTTKQAYTFLGRITSQYAVGDIVPVENFDQMLVDLGMMANTVPEDRAHPDWGSRVYQRNKARTVINRHGKDLSPPVQLVQKEHPGKDHFGTLQLQDAQRFALATVEKKSNGSVTHFRGVRKTIEKHIRDMGDYITPAAMDALYRLRDQAEIKEVEADATAHLLEGRVAAIIAKSKES